MDETTNWKMKRVGFISASRLSDLMTKGRGKSSEWGQTAISYLYQIERERYTGCPPINHDAPALSFGRENEQYAVEWIRENISDKIRYYETDFPEKPFITVDWARFGATPDVDIPDENGNPETIIEIKTTYSDSAIHMYFSPSKPYEKKRIAAFEEHRDQLAGQLLACPTCNEICILKYNPQRDEEEWDTINPLDPSRGILFRFKRSEFGEYLDVLRNRIITADKFLETGQEIELINNFKL